MSSVVLIRDLLYQSAGIVFLDGGRVICKRLTVKKYETTRSIAHITIYNKHKHNHHYSHDTSSSLELSQSMPKLISQLARTGMAAFQLPFPTFFANLSGVLGTETVEATMAMAV